MKPPLKHRHFLLPRPWLIALLLWIGLAGAAGAAPISPAQAESAVRAWLARTPVPLGERIGSPAAGAQAFRNAQGAADFYVVNLNPSGYVIVAGEDLVEPIIGFFPSGRFDASTQNPVGALVSLDVRQRVADSRAEAKAAGKNYAPKGARAAANTKWALLLAPSKPLADVNDSLINDPRVDPFVQSRWGQDNVGGLALYNYYTPPFEAGNTGNYPAGCLATAMAQVMAYHHWPQIGVGTAPFLIAVDQVGTIRTLRGGDGAGGPYDWANMVMDPQQYIAPSQRPAIGALVHDAAVAIETSFTEFGSGAIMLTAKTRIKSVFKFSNSAYSSNNSSQWAELGAALPAIINPNLDAGLPVILGIRNDPPITNDAFLHAIVVDGYGYNGGTIYHHCNMGWSGSSNGWYNLPNIGTGYNFNVVFECLYNLFTSGTGELASGRVVDAAGLPIAGATVSAVATGVTTVTAQTNERGIYAFQHLPSLKTYTLTAKANTYVFASTRSVSIDKSDIWPLTKSTSGNAWGANFQAQPDAFPRVQITSSTTSRREDSGSVTLIVRRNAAPAYPSVVDVAVSGGTATAGADFTLSSSSVTIAAGQTTASFSIHLINDALGEAQETVELTLTPRSSCLPGKVLTHTLTIVDDDNFLAEALDNYQVFWKTRGDLPWAPQTGTSHDGADAAQSGAIEAEQTSTLWAYVTGPGTLGFWWGVNAPAGDRLTFNDNGTTAVLTGNSGFQQYTRSLGAGVHLLQWTLSRAAGSTGTAGAWVDQVTWTGGVPAAATPTPFYGIPISIPGPIEAEDFDLGGNPAAYFDNTPGNAGDDSYRPGEDVDISICNDLDDGKQVDHTAADEWLQYTVNVSTTGLYTLRLRVAAAAAGGRCRIELGTTVLAGEIDIPATGGASVWQTVELTGVPLAAGPAVLKFKILSGGFSLNRMEFIPETGTLRVVIDPPEIVAAGAKWRRVGTTYWRNSGASDPIVPAGWCQVEYTDITGWTKPVTTPVWIDKDQATDLTGRYVRQVGFLFVAINPAEAASAGAQWRRVGTETWINSGATEGVYTGQYQVEFKQAPSWKRPANLNVSILNKQTVTTMATYLPAGSLNVNIFPGIAAGAGAKWRRVGTTPWFASGAIEEEVPAGTHQVEFQPANGWNAPGPLEVIMEQGQFLEKSATFTRQTGGLRVNLGPAEAVTAGAGWRLYGTIPWLASGAGVPDLPTGNYIVQFKPVAAWQIQTSMTATVQYNTTVTATGTYASLTGSLRVTLGPASALAAGAAWRRTGTTAWLAGGATESGLAPGNYTVEFKGVPGWTAPASAGVTITKGQTTPLSRNYQVILNAVRAPVWTRYR